MKIMCPEDPRWDSFCDLLVKNLNNFGGCKHTLYWSKTALRIFYPDCDINETVRYFQNRGGYCDCEILMNVDT